MKRFFLVIILLALISCSSTQLIENWKNPDIDSYAPSKVLVVGLTSNLEARQTFEKQLKDALESRGAEAVMSLDIFEPSFRNEKMTEEQLKVLEDNLVNNGFDTVLFSKVIGVEDIIAYKENYDGYDQTHRRFSQDYLMYQDIYYNPDYYDEYTVYHAETSMYCICPTKERELVWKGYIDIVDPESIGKTVSDYVNLVIAVLEAQQLINPKTLQEENLIETPIN